MDDAPDPDVPARAHWRRTRATAGALAALWALVTFMPPLFWPELSFDVMGAPAAVWIAALIAPATYVLLAWWYQRRAEQIDARYQADRGH